jgi:hypothetical protein
VGIVKSLPCKLTAEELRIKGETLGRIVKTIEIVEDEKKQANSEFGDRLKELRQKLEQTSNDVVNATESREIMCTEQPDHENRMVDIIRTDTKEVVERRPMTEDEMQGNLFAIDGGADGDEPENDESAEAAATGDDVA